MMPPTDALTSLLTFHRSIRVALQVFASTAGLASAGLFDVIRVSALSDFFCGPLRWHDEDEALSLLPRLLDVDPERARGPIAACALEHARVAQAIDGVLDHLQALTDGSVAPDAELLATVNHELQTVFTAHLLHEEQEIFPLARAVLNNEALRQMGLEMHARRLLRLQGPMRATALSPNPRQP